MNQIIHLNVLIYSFTYGAQAIEKITSLWESLIKVIIGVELFSNFHSTLRISPKAEVTIIVVGFIHLMQLQIKFVLFLKTKKYFYLNYGSINTHACKYKSIPI